MKKLLTFALALLFLSSALGNTALAGTGSNVGNEQNISGVTFDISGKHVAYTCAYVHRTRTATGFEEKQSCTLASNATLPTKTTVVKYGANSWASDYVIATTGSWRSIATHWEQRFTPGGQVLITSFYKS